MVRLGSQPRCRGGSDEKCGDGPASLVIVVAMLDGGNPRRYDSATNAVGGSASADGSDHRGEGSVRTIQMGKWPTTTCWGRRRPVRDFK